MPMDQQSALQRAIELTDEILQLLDEGEFESVVGLESERQNLIEMTFASSLNEIDAIKARHLHSLNVQVVEKLELLKKNVQNEQARLRTANRVNHAYQDQCSGAG